VLYHLNAEALRTQSPVLELEDSLTAFVRRTLGLDPKGRNIRIVKDQLTRLASADFRFGMGMGAPWKLLVPDVIRWISSLLGQGTAATESEPKMPRQKATAHRTAIPKCT
jgi:hypothetical protein